MNKENNFNLKIISSQKWEEIADPFEGHIELLLQAIEQVNTIAHTIEDWGLYERPLAVTTDEPANIAEDILNTFELRTLIQEIGGDPEDIDVLDPEFWFTLKDYLITILLWYQGRYTGLLRVAYCYHGHTVDKRARKRSTIFRDFDEDEFFYDLLEIRYRDYVVHAIPWFIPWDRVHEVKEREYWRSDELSDDEDIDDALMRLRLASEQLCAIAAKICPQLWA